ncbi:MAG: hypothetical protein JWM21_3604 [Acidobacteria bacterium]|nr:hypothetical protein [Acidobacteriota bacterium]
MTPDPTSKILESLEEFVQKQTAELESQNELLLERAKKEFEELLSEQAAGPLSLARHEQKSLVTRKHSVEYVFLTIGKSVLKAWRKTIFFARRAADLISRRFKKNH